MKNKKTKEEMLIEALVRFKKMYDRQILMANIGIALSAVSIGACIAMIIVFMIMMIR